VNVTRDTHISALNHQPHNLILRHELLPSRIVLLQSCCSYPSLAPPRSSCLPPADLLHTARPCTASPCVGPCSPPSPPPPGRRYTEAPPRSSWSSFTAPCSPWPTCSTSPTPPDRALPAKTYPIMGCCGPIRTGPSIQLFFSFSFSDTQWIRIYGVADTYPYQIHI
jgi:hypothetical protein